MVDVPVRVGFDGPHLRSSDSVRRRWGNNDGNGYNLNHEYFDDHEHHKYNE